MNNNYCVYMHRNIKNGKLYFGQTCQDVEQRWKNGKGYDKCPKFWEAIIADGWNNFEHVILCSDLTKEEANKQETFYIQSFHTCNPQFGYNIRLGQEKEVYEELCNIELNHYILHCDIDEIKRSSKKEYIVSNTNDVFRSREDAAKWAGLSNGTNITKNSNNDPRHKTAGIHPQTKERLTWRKVSKEDILSSTLNQTIELLN